MSWYNRYVPNEGPDNAKIMLVGEAPGESEHDQLRPFVGDSGQLLITCLGRNGVLREEVYLANLAHYRPYDNKFEKLLNTQELKDGIAELYKDIMRIRPNVIVALGGNPLMYLTGKKGIKKWRGSILSCLLDENIKVIPTYHPAAVLRERSLYPIFDADLKRCIADSHFPEKNLPKREFILNPRGLDLEEWTQRLCSSGTLACDIETVKKSTHILCVGFAPSPEVGVCIVPTGEGRRAIERILESDTRKIFQFGTFDTTQLKLNNYTINDPYARKLDDCRPYYWDTLLAQRALTPELPRSLEFLASVYTREPYYKTEGRFNIPEDNKGWSEKVNKQALYEYNARDCCVTFEVYLKQRELLLAKDHRGWKDKENLSTFDFDMSMLDPAHHLADSGMLIDSQRRQLLEIVSLEKWAKLQFILDKMTGYETNVRSPKLKMILYDKDKLGLPTRRNHDGTITTDEDAIVSLIAYCKDHLEGLKKPDAIAEWKIKLAVCETILKIRGIRQVLSNYLRENPKNPRLRADGRMHSTYKVGGPETGRWSSTKYVDGSGLNAQTFARDPIEVDEERMKRFEEEWENDKRTEMLQLIDADIENEDEEEEQEAA